MIYFLTEPETDGGYFGTYNKAIRSEFTSRKIPYQEIKLQGPWISQEDIELLSRIESRDEDIWLLAYALNPVISVIQHKPGKKYGHVHGMECMPFEPALLNGYRLDEKFKFDFYHGLFFNSAFALETATQAYPHLGSRFFNTGFPFDPEPLKKYLHSPKKPDLIVFNQRFALDKLHILEVHLSEILTRKGFVVAHLCPSSDISRIKNDREARALLREGQKRGLILLVNQTKDEYYRNLAQAEIAISTSLADTLSLSTLEAVSLGVAPLAPRWGPFPEYLKERNMYPPFNLDIIIKKINRKPRAQAHLKPYHPTKVVKQYLKVMGGIS